MYFLPCSPVNNSQDGCYILPPALKELDISHSEEKEFFIDFQDDICIRSKLEHLSMRNLKVAGPIGIISGLHDLKSFDISNTGFPFQTMLFHDLEALESVNASGNRLFERQNGSSFAELFTSNKNLKYVDLSENGISEIPYNMFYQNRVLQSIDLSSNKLQYLHLNLTVSKYLEHLFLSNNDFKHLGGEGAITLEFIPSNHNIKAISGISEETGLMCRCNRHSTNASSAAKINNTCNSMKENTRDSIIDTRVTLFRCSRAVLENITNSLDVDGQSTNGLTIGISILVFGLAVVSIVAIIVAIRRNRQHTRKEENSLPDQIELQQNDHEIIENNVRIPDEVKFQEHNRKNKRHALDQMEIQGNHGVVENKGHDQVEFNILEHNRVENHVHFIDQIDLRERCHDTVENNENTDIDQIELQEHYRKSAQDYERVAQYYIGINDTSFGTPDRHPRFIRKTRPCNEYPLKPHFYIVKLGYAGVYLFFLFLLQNIDCGYSLEPPRRGGSNVYPQSMF